MPPAQRPFHKYHVKISKYKKASKCPHFCFKNKLGNLCLAQN